MLDYSEKLGPHRLDKTVPRNLYLDFFSLKGLGRNFLLMGSAGIRGRGAGG